MGWGRPETENSMPAKTGEEGEEMGDVMERHVRGKGGLRCLPHGEEGARGRRGREADRVGP